MIDNRPAARSGEANGCGADERPRQEKTGLHRGVVLAVFCLATGAAHRLLEPLGMGDELTGIGAVIAGVFASVAALLARNSWETAQGRVDPVGQPGLRTSKSVH